MPDDHRKPSAWNKSKLPSRHITVGPERAPHRAMFYAMGVTEEQLKQLLELEAMTHPSRGRRIMPPSPVKPSV